jgi:hypothetical protein
MTTFPLLAEKTSKRDEVWGVENMVAMSAFWATKEEAFEGASSREIAQSEENHGPKGAEDKSEHDDDEKVKDLHWEMDV